MIGKLKGLVDAVGESYVVVDVNGVGYEVQASARTLRTLKVGEAVSLAIETHVREDAIRLYGFTSEIERAWFRTLQTIQGVGAKVALAVLGTLAPQDLANAIALQNWAAVEQSPGVGKKLAQRIVAELKDKAPALSVAGLNVPAAAHRAGTNPQRYGCRGHFRADQSRLSARACEPGGRGGHGGAGRGGRYAQAHSPRLEGAGTVTLATGLPQFEPTRPQPLARPTQFLLMQIYLPIAELSLNVLLLLGMGFAIGFLSGMFGVGGGFILTPLLIFLGVPSAIAVGTSASQVVAASVSSALGHWRRNNVDVHMGLLLTSGGFVGAMIGVVVLGILRARGQLDIFVALTYVVLLGVVGALMLIESVHTMRASPVKAGGGRHRGGQHTWIEGLPLKTRFRHSRIYASTIPFVAVGAFIGLLTGIMGVGGGFLLIPAMIYLLRIPTRIVIGTSTFQIVCVTAFATVMQATLNQTVDLLLSLPLMAGSVIGAQFGVGYAERFKAEQLRALLALIVLAVAVRIAFGLVIRPSDLFSIDASP